MLIELHMACYAMRDRFQAEWMTNHLSKPYNKDFGASERLPAWRRSDFLIVAIAILLCFIVFANTIAGDFVYDDRSQIVDNRFIQQDVHIVRALSSPVWAFANQDIKGNYWRPTFTAWLILNFRLFGFHPAGWHLTNILLHALTAFLLYGLLRRLQLERALAAAVTFIFAVHPVQVESVAWISGSPNMLFAAPLLGSLWLVIDAVERSSMARWAISLGLYVIALLAKEPAVIFPVLVYGAVLWFCGGSLLQKVKHGKAVLAALPFALLAGVFLIVRMQLLGHFQLNWNIGPLVLLATLPSLLFFYLRQVFLPFWFIPVYSVRPVELINLEDFAIPLAVLIVAGILLFYLAIKSPQGKLGGLFFAAFLIPALNISGFHEEHLVHDRYLYLPLTGLLLVVIPGLSAILRNRLPVNASYNRRIFLPLAMLICAGLSAETIRYNRAWLSELALWDWEVQSNPTSAFSLMRHALALQEAGRKVEAQEALNKALVIRPTVEGYYLRAVFARQDGRFADTEKVLLSAAAEWGDSPLTYTLLADLYYEQKRIDDGIAILKQGREKVPKRYCDFTGKMATLMVMADRRDEARKELETVRDLVPEEINDQSRMVLYILGNLYRDSGEIGPALAAYQDFVDLCADCTDEDVVAQRRQALKILNSGMPLR